MVIALNTRTILSIFRDMKVLTYASIGWGDDEVVQLAEVLPLCTSATELSLGNNKNISDRGAKALAAAFAEGAMPKLEKLVLGGNQIGDDGAVALAEAAGARARCRSSRYSPHHNNQIGDDGALAWACRVEARGTLAQKQPDWRRRRARPRSSREGRAAGAQDTRPQQATSFLRRAKDAWEAVKAKRSGLDVSL